jgi:hypothetical protein
MRTAILYYEFLIVYGGVAAVLGLDLLFSGRINITGVLLAVSGCGILGSVTYQTVSPSGSFAAVPDDRVVRFMTAMAFLAVLAGIWSAVP